ncbi:MAG: energy-coupling factor transporter ATPase, partial [Clostridia bacterium]|nr:energy-coupling factor transporter ATPase [Clostridia bacterium]
QKQRVAIAGILAMDPEIVIFDEATAMLDPVGRAEVIGVINDMRRRGVTVILITHYMDEATGCDRAIVLSDGKIALDGTPREVFSLADEIRAAGLNVPQIAELAERLRKRGYDIPRSVITYGEMAEAVEALKNGKR